MPDPIIEIDSEGMQRARDVAQWEIGDPSWAEMIVHAYLDPNDPNAAEARDGIYSE